MRSKESGQGFFSGCARLGLHHLHVQAPVLLSSRLAPVGDLILCAPEQLWLLKTKEKCSQVTVAFAAYHARPRIIRAKGAISEFSFAQFFSSTRCSVSRTSPPNQISSSCVRRSTQERDDLETLPGDAKVGWRTVAESGVKGRMVFCDCARTSCWHLLNWGVQASAASSELRPLVARVG